MGRPLWRPFLVPIKGPPARVRLVSASRSSSMTALHGTFIRITGLSAGCGADCDDSDPKAGRSKKGNDMTKTFTKLSVIGAASLLGVALAASGAYAATGSPTVRNSPGHVLHAGGAVPTMTGTSTATTMPTMTGSTQPAVAQPVTSPSMNMSSSPMMR
jgi:hypothetical protein